MVFSTAIFVFAFLPVFLGVYYLLPFRLRSAWILAASLLFYGWWRLDFLSLIVATTIWTYYLGGKAASRIDREGARRAMIAGTLLNIGTLAYFKYFNFGIESLDALIRGLGGSGLTAWNVVLPVGISFYVFQATSYLIDLYRGDAEPAPSYLDLAAYIALFPQLVAGPIVRYRDVASQFQRRDHTFPLFSEGARRFMIGFAKKVLIADTVSTLVDAAFTIPSPHAIDAWLGTIAYAVQIFFDFSGYSDMAIGLGLMIGFRFRENFDRPYQAWSITEFWKRWHISLSSWLRNYLYIPLGGNRRGRRRTYINLVVVMLLGGLWHGAAWTFVIWGAWHGLWLMVERYIADRRERSQIPDSTAGGILRDKVFGIIGVVYTGVIVLLGWVFFRAPSISIALEVLQGMVGFNGLALSPAMAWSVSRSATIALIVGLVLVYLPRWRRTNGERSIATDSGTEPLPGHPDTKRALALVGRVAQPAYHAGLSLLFIASLLKLSAERFSPFLYFQF